MLWGCSSGNFGFRRRGCGALRSPIPPRVTGCERVHTLSRSPGAVRPERLVSDETGRRRVWNSSACSSAPVRSKISTSDEAVRLFWWKLWFPTTRAWGAPLPYTPRGRGARGFTPSRALPGAVRSERLVSDETDGQRVWDSGAHTFAAGQTKLWFLTEQAGGAFGTAAHVLPRLFGRRFWFPAGQAGGAYLPRLFECCFGFRENARGVPLGTEAGESHIITSRFRRSFSLQRNACTALFRWTGCERSSHPVAPKNGEFMKFID